MHWSLKTFQELQHVSETERCRLLREAAPAGTYARLIARSLGLGLIAGGGVAVLLQRALHLPGISLAVLGLVLIVGCAICLYQYHLIRIRGQLLTYLEDAATRERLPMCLFCGYNLEGLPGDRCPECGKRIHGDRH